MNGPVVAGRAAGDLRPIGVVGFVGLGDQGAPIARRILHAGYALVVWARRPSTIQAFDEPASSIADDLTELGQRCDLVGICVRDDDGVRSIAFNGLLSAMRPGSVLAIHSTVHPDTCIEVANVAAESAIRVVDAPVSGGRQVAENGDLTVMVGADHDEFAHVRPVFESFGRPVRLGALGSGQTAKLINNTLMSANIALAAAAIESGRDLGIDASELARLLSTSSGRSAGLATLTKVMAARRAGALEILAKDIDHFAAVRSAGDAGAQLEEAGRRGLAALGALVGP